MIKLADDFLPVAVTAYLEVIDWARLGYGYFHGCLLDNTNFLKDGIRREFFKKTQSDEFCTMSVV